ncbi:MAG: ATP-binding protein [Bacteroidales bacterium]|nr:ATP-binding protein [Bacteroidales bacterium]
MIKRETYLRQFRQLKDKKLIKVVTGIRRAGKSTLMQLFQEELKTLHKVAPEAVLAINFEQREFAFQSWTEAYDYIEQKLSANSNYVFLDEVQQVPQFEKLVDALYVRPDVDLYVTGSNAYLLSSEMATLLSGRYVEIHVFPFSFAEYEKCFPEERNINKIFMKYINSSSFPEAVSLSVSAPEMERKYLEAIFDTVVIKDISKRHSLRKTEMLQNLLSFMFDSIGSLTAARNIAASLSKSGNEISHNTVAKYLDFFTESYLLYSAPRYDLKGKRLLSSNKKYYAVDLGLRNILLANRHNTDLGHKIENVVYLELMRRHNSQVYVGKNEDREVDFMVQQPDGMRAYYQVSYTLMDAKTRERELESLRRLNNSYPKFILTMDYEEDIVDGIKIRNIIDWLLEAD